MLIRFCDLCGAQIHENVAHLSLKHLGSSGAIYSSKEWCQKCAAKLAAFLNTYKPKTRAKRLGVK